MSVRLIRENSDTPNITNRDDARMIRYAYGGQNGFVKGRGTELSHTVNGNVFTINSGVINLQGWEVEIDSNGWSTTLSVSDAARKYCAVYCEVNLSLGGSAKIDLMTALNSYPDVPEGDDLTENPGGTARLVLYQFIAQSGNISDVNKIVNMMLYGAVMTTRPPISSISFQNGQLLKIKYSSFGGANYEISEGRVRNETNRGAYIAYLPKGSDNSIAKVEFEYSGDDICYYLADDYEGNLICFSKGYLYSDSIGKKRDITANIFDIYGNVFKINWSVEVSSS